ncbi:M55 family metallopeptidase [Micromonospora sp. LOL_025]
MTTEPGVLISADMEGITGIVHPTGTNPGGYDYERSGVQLLVQLGQVKPG